jgi:ZIP zinc/iron transport family
MFEYVCPLQPAIAALTNPCLGAITVNYEALPMFICMATVFVMQLIEFLISRNMNAKNNSSALQEPPKDIESGSAPAPLSEMKVVTAAADDHKHHQHQHQHQHEQQQQQHQQHSHSHSHSHHVHCVDTSSVETSAHTRSFVTLIIFELGVAFHSVIIGLALGIISGPEFRTLLAALVFHQFFEGFALGSAIIGIDPSKSTTAKTVLAYVLSTPIGIAIGIVIRSTYNENSSSALWTQGVFDSVSAGTLLYAGLVELLTYGLTINPKFAATGAVSRGTVTTAFLSLYAGAGAMSLIGKWA